MRPLRAFAVLGIVLLSAFASAGTASARTLVDPTTLTPPLKPFRVCYELGPYVQCDTSGVGTVENEPTDDSPCGQIYETHLEQGNSTRWYQDGLLIRRQVQNHVDGTWSLSPTGDGPTVAFARDASWDELFAVPGDIDSGVTTVHGNTLRVPALGSELHESGQFRPDGTNVGHFTSDDPAAIAQLCALLVG
jgi:hypothetical protein